MQHTVKVRGILSELIPLISMMHFLQLIGVLNPIILLSLELPILTASARSCCSASCRDASRSKLQSSVQIARMENLRTAGSGDR